MKKLTEKFKFQLEKLLPKKIEVTPEHILGRDNFTNIVELLKEDVLVNFEKEELRKSFSRTFTFSYRKDGKVYLQSFFSKLESVKDCLPLKSLRFFENLTKDIKTNSREHTMLGKQRVIWEVEASEFSKYIDENFDTSEVLYNKMKRLINPLKDFSDKQDIQELLASHSSTLQSIYDILIDAHETKFVISPENKEGIIEILENFRVVISEKINVLNEQRKIEENIEKEKQYLIFKATEQEKENKISFKQKKIEEMLSIERELQTQFLL